MSDLKGKRILVTGATGFIGNRLVERLVLEHGADVVALVHQYRNASRLARFPVKLIQGDVADRASVANVAKGCCAIIHAAVSFKGSSKQNRRVTVEGARNICEAAKNMKARLVHFSTFSVYGETAPGPLNENAPKNPGNDAYGASKLEAEQLVQRYQQQGVAATILQPTVVYGPWSFWSSHAARQLNAGRVALPDGGRGLCNAVYVDDVIDAVFLSLGTTNAANGPFLISGKRPVTWREYFLAHATGPAQQVCDIGERVVRRKHKIPEEVKILVRKVTSIRSRRVVRAILAEFRSEPKTPRASGEDDDVVILPDYEKLPLYRSRSEVSSDKAAQELGYQPRFSLFEGGQLTRDWLNWSGLIQTK